MNKKQLFVVFGIVAMFLLAAIAIQASSAYHFPAKYKGLVRGVDKASLLSRAKQGPCASFGCGVASTVVGDKDAKKSYSCACNKPALSKDKAVCFMSMAASKKVGYRQQACRR